MKKKINYIRRILFVIIFIIPAIYFAQPTQSSLTSMPAILLIYHSVKFFSAVSFLLLILFRIRWIAVINILFDVTLIALSTTYSVGAVTGWYVCSCYVTLGFQLMCLSFILGWVYSRGIFVNGNFVQTANASLVENRKVVNCSRAVFVSFAFLDLFILVQYVATSVIETTPSFFVLNFWIPTLLMILIVLLHSMSLVAAWVIGAGYLVDVFIMSVFIFIKNIQSFPEQISAEVITVSVISLFIQFMFCIVFYLTRVRSVFKVRLVYIVLALVVAAILVVYDLHMIEHPDSPFYNYGAGEEFRQ